LRRFLAGLALALLTLVGLAGPAFADGLTIRKVDTTKFPTVAVAVLSTGAPVNLADVHLRENGQIVNDINAVPIGKTGTPVGVVLAIDTSGSMAQNNKMESAKSAARQFVQSRGPNDQIAIVSFASQPRVVVNFTSDPNLLLNGINTLQPTGETALWEGVRTAAGLFGDHPDLQPNIVLLTDGKDTVSGSNASQAQASAQSAHAAVFSVGLQGGDFDGGPIQALAQVTGGQYLATANPAALTQLYGQVQQSIQNQYQISYTSKSTADALQIEVAAGGATASSNATVGGVAQGTNTQPDVVDANGGTFGFL